MGIPCLPTALRCLAPTAEHSPMNSSAPSTMLYELHPSSTFTFLAPFFCYLLPLPTMNDVDSIDPVSPTMEHAPPDLPHPLAPPNPLRSFPIRSISTSPLRSHPPSPTPAMPAITTAPTRTPEALHMTVASGVACSSRTPSASTSDPARFILLLMVPDLTGSAVMVTEAVARADLSNVWGYTRFDIHPCLPMFEIHPFHHRRCCKRQQGRLGGTRALRGRGVVAPTPTHTNPLRHRHAGGGDSFDGHYAVSGYVMPSRSRPPPPSHRACARPSR